LPATGSRRALARLDGTLRVDERELLLGGECNTGAAASAILKVANPRIFEIPKSAEK
jgi:hypothetical protein